MVAMRKCPRQLVPRALLPLLCVFSCSKLSASNHAHASTPSLGLRLRLHRQDYIFGSIVRISGLPLRLFNKRFWDCIFPWLARPDIPATQGSEKNNLKVMSQEDEKEVSEKLIKIFKKSTFNNLEQKFLPEGEIERKGLITTKAVAKALEIDSNNLTDEDKKLIAFVQERATKVFIIAVHCGIYKRELRTGLSFLMARIEDGLAFTDESLPIKEPSSGLGAVGSTEGDEQSESGESSNSLPENDEFSEVDEPSENRKSGNQVLMPTPDQSSELRDDRDLQTFDRASQVWTAPRILDFYDKQWRFLSPVFSPSQSNYDLDNNEILPFTKKGNVRKGAFGQVFKVKIFQGHYKELEGPNSLVSPKYFAIKEIIPSTDLERDNVESEWEKEAKILQSIAHLQHPNIVRFITAFRRGQGGEDGHYLMFEWADGGSLRDLWGNKEKRPVGNLLTAEYVKNTVTQLLGLSKALEATHYNSNSNPLGFTQSPETSANIRHGDIKPENILWFRQKDTDRQKDTESNDILKIGDWGLAKHHNVATELRTQKTSTRHGTLRYEAPERAIGLKDTNLKISRLYDLWSMGCVIFEYIVWLLLGPRELEKFVSESSTTFYQIYGEGETKKARVDPTVDDYMDQFARASACKNTALGDLLRIVRTKLLVVDRIDHSPKSSIDEEKYPTSIIRVTHSDPDESPHPNSEGIFDEKTSQHFRANAKTLQEELEKILKKGVETKGYWLSQTAIGHLTFHSRKNQQHLTTSYGGISKIPATKSAQDNRLAPQKTVTDYTAPELTDTWDLSVDNSFAGKVLSKIEQLFPIFSSQALCEHCQKQVPKIFDNAFSVEYETTALKKMAVTCALCELFWDACKRARAENHHNVRFQRINSHFQMNGSGPPALSIFKSPGLETRVNIQIGLPELPSPRSSTHFEIIRQWLKLCDDEDEHPKCHTSVSKAQPTPKSQHQHAQTLPTRLIDVGEDNKATVHLIETGQGEGGKYIALSHPWGSPPHFCTTRDNLQAHKDGINVDALPATFRDAVITTRKLGIRYLWIDSICIIQKSENDDGDFNAESGKMEMVFSSAYCIIAASRAINHESGFLQEYGRKRRYVTLRRPGDKADFYICESIDDFENNILNGFLNQRGWVFQEHALARRTIFFADTQTYWECGDGVRCETLTKMSNNRSSFLGDPYFPNIIMDVSRGEKIVRFQNLYKQYSHLSFSRPEDRAVAINGLESRLLEAFRTKGGFGIFDEGDGLLQSTNPKDRKGLLRRSLLWCRAEGTGRFERIDFPANRQRVPSWSWMAFTGAIDYLEMGFDGVEWAAIRSPWSLERESSSATQIEGQNNAWVLTAQARDITNDDLGAENITLDVPGGPETPKMKVVVLGIERGSERRHFVLAISKTSSRSEVLETYERVGAGWVREQFLSQNVSSVQIY